MCGIIGMFAFDKGSTTKEKKMRRESMLFLFTEVLQRTRTRGPDATGVSAIFSDGDSMIQKGNIKSPEFIANYGGTTEEYDGFLDACRESDADLSMLIGHCRKSSVGNTWDNENNHPIKAGEIIGVHNGTLKNHEIVFEKLNCRRDGEVDSEAIMRLLESLTNDCEDPFTLDTLEETFRRLEGAFTIIAANANNPYQAALIRKERPMEIAIIRPLKLVIVVSEKCFLEEAMFDYNKQAMLYGNKDFDPIGSDDVDFLTLPLDNIAVLDLTMTIDDTTKLPDLIEKKDAFKSKRIWQVPAKSYVNNHQNWQGNRNNLPNNQVGNQVKETPKNSGSASKESVDAFPGKVFCKHLNAYVAPAVSKTLSGEGPLLLTNPGGKIKNISDDAVDKLVEVLKKVDQLDVTIEQESLDIVDESNPVIKVTVPENTVEKDVTPKEDPEILKAAKEEGNGLSRYDTLAEVVLDLDATSEEAVEALPIHALANRIKASMYEQAFIDGANWYKKLHNSLGGEKAIRVAKHVVTVFGTLIDKLSGKDVSTYKEDLMITVAEFDTGEITKSNIKHVFSKGNLLKNQPLNVLEDVAKD